LKLAVEIEFARVALSVVGSGLDPSPESTFPKFFMVLSGLS